MGNLKFINAGNSQIRYLDRELLIIFGHYSWVKAGILVSVVRVVWRDVVRLWLGLVVL